LIRHTYQILVIELSEFLSISDLSYMNEQTGSYCLMLHTMNLIITYV